MPAQKAPAKTIRAAELARIRALNTAFTKASPAKRRMIIAADVINQIETQKLKPISGCYVHVGPEHDRLFRGQSAREEAADWLEVTKTSGMTGPLCRACALGSLFVSCVDIAMPFTLQEAANIAHDLPYIVNDSDILTAATTSAQDRSLRKNFQSLFSKEQFYLIEAAFECDEMPRSFDLFLLDEEDRVFESGDYDKAENRWDSKRRALEAAVRKAVRFGERYETPRARLLAIMKNILKNKGKFVPWKQRQKPAKKNPKNSTRLSTRRSSKR